MFGLGTSEIVIIFIIVLILFGSKRIPELGRGLADGIKNFKKGMKEGEKVIEEDASKKEDKENKS